MMAERARREGRTGAPRGTNCGRNANTKAAALGLARIVTRPTRNPLQAGLGLRRSIGAVIAAEQRPQTEHDQHPAPMTRMASQVAAGPPGPGRESRPLASALHRDYHRRIVGSAPATSRSTSVADGERPLLSVRDVSVRFGGLVALDSVSFDVPRGCIVGLIGPNGAGKTTLFNVVTRIYRASGGEIHLEDRNLLAARPAEIIGLGIARTFQNVAISPRMTVLDTVLTGYHCRLAGNPLYFALAGF